MSLTLQATSVLAPSLDVTLNERQLFWQTLVKWLPQGSSSHNWWWKTLGGHVTSLLDLAEYSLNDQLEALLFLYHWVAPRMGPRPVSTTPAWKSFMTDDYTPIEYSWKWGKDHKAPDIRYSIEAIGALAGTASDPLNQVAARELLYDMSKYASELDLTWFEHFSHALLGPGTPASSSTAPAGATTVFLAFEVLRGHIGAKAYFLPVSSPEQSAAEQILQAIRSAGCRNLNANRALEAFLTQDPAGSDLSPFMLGIDCVAPEASRLKIYARSTKTSLSFAHRVMDLGGRRSVSRVARGRFSDLWQRTLGLHHNSSPDEELPSVHHETAGLLFYLDVAPKGDLPDVKTYLPVRHYAQSDLQAARGLVSYLEDQGQGRYAQAYLRSLETFESREKLERTTGVQTYITVAYQGDDLSVTSYFSPQIYAPSKWS